jgi:hypothetical protein
VTYKAPINKMSDKLVSMVLRILDIEKEIKVML